MAMMIDKKPEYKGESKVWEILSDNLPGEAIVYNGREVNGREFDFCILMKNIGMIVIEVKGWIADSIFDVAGVDEIIIQGYDKPETSVYKGYKQDKIEMRGDRAEMSDFPLYLNTVAGGLDRRDQTIGGFSFVVKIYAVPVVEIIGQLLYLLGRYGFNTQFGDCL